MATGLLLNAIWTMPYTSGNVRLSSPSGYFRHMWMLLRGVPVGAVEVVGSKEAATYN